MSGRGREQTDPIWWLENEDHYLSTLKHKVNVYQHNLQDNPAVTTQRVERLFKNLVENNPMEVHPCIFNEDTVRMEHHGFGVESSEEEDDDYTYEDEDYSNDDDDHNVNTFCGLRRNFLSDIPELSSKHKDITDPYSIQDSNSYRGSAEEAERIGQELVNEEEQAKRKAEKRRLKKKKVLSKKESCSDGEEDDEEQTADSNALNAKILELAVQGNSMANKGRYGDAVEYFTEAIKYDPKEYRLFGNRSYCYERLKQYSRALSDAQIAVNLNPSWPKGYFRKARALAGVKRYIEAIEAFQEVLRIDSSCKDAEYELLQVQMQLMMERGFTQQQCEEILSKYGSLEQVLLSSAPKPRNSHINTSIYVSDEDDKDFVRVKKSKNKPASLLVQPQLQQPRELFPIWIGNVTTRITEEALRTKFETVGIIHSIRMLQDRFCAFINFTTKQGAERAIAELQGTELEGTKLVIRHPDNNYKNLGAAKTAAPAVKPSLVEKVKIPPTIECHFWRNIGCVYGDKCRFRHIPQHKGVDSKVSQN
ncbi:uncharacterized protein LOC144688523 isoform X10 [Cetorhinus maximus]